MKKSILNIKMLLTLITVCGLYFNPHKYHQALMDAIQGKAFYAFSSRCY